MCAYMLVTAYTPLKTNCDYLTAGIQSISYVNISPGQQKKRTKTRNVQDTHPAAVRTHILLLRVKSLHVFANAIVILEGLLAVGTGEATLRVSMSGEMLLQGTHVVIAWKTSVRLTVTVMVMLMMLVVVVKLGASKQLGKYMWQRTDTDTDMLKSYGMTGRLSLGFTKTCFISNLFLNQHKLLMNMGRKSGLLQKTQRKPQMMI